ncbi:serine hydrolase domain-containing protein [Legionella pneumophila]|uniref:serine hydrolase domain-containing protein n=1 Tax=Legionella pneumophila TaxID=446 RepID=UPI003CB5C5A6
MKYNQMQAKQELVKEMLNNAHVPALSMSWCQENMIKTMASGVTDTSELRPVSTLTLFQAASLSKPVSAAIVLDLVEQDQWDLDTPLAHIADYGPPELKYDPYYQELTTRMVLGQCSGLPNWFPSEETKKFINKPGIQFNYSGVAFDFLKEVIEKELKTSWEAIAQAFFAKVGMINSTFKQLPASHLRDVRSVARGHQADGTPNPVVAPIDSPEVPAGSLLTTANDYMRFLQYCFVDSYLRSTLLTGITPVTLITAPNASCQWGLGMGIYTDAEKTIAFHWGNNTGSHAFCAMNMKTGDCIACFVNSDNGPNVFQPLAESVVGDMTPLFQMLYTYCNFNAGRTAESPKLITTASFQLVHSESIEDIATVSDGQFSVVPRASQLHTSFFKTLLQQQLKTEAKLMPKSVSWWELEIAEKREILEAFWWKKIMDLHQESVDGLKEHILLTHFPKSKFWEEKIERLFSDAVSRKIDFEQFFAELKYLPMLHVRGMAQFEHIPLPHTGEVIEPKSEIGPTDFINIKRYLTERGITGAVSFGFADKSMVTPDFSEHSRGIYAMHSVGKVFTGMLTLRMIQEGILSEKELNEPLNQDFIDSLAVPSSVKQHLLENHVTLHQLMTHKAGLGDYLEEYGKTISQGKNPEMNRAEDFLQFAEAKTYPVGKQRYSNLGILLVGLAVKHAYEKKHDACEYHDLLSKYIIDPIGMPSFSSKRPEENAKYNPDDTMAPHIAGSPAGGYWVSAEDLAKFGQWIYKSCQEDPHLLELIKKYGQEFYNEEHNMVSHGGAIASSSAFLSVSLNTGAVVAVLSDQPDMAFELNSMMQGHVFAKRPEIEEELEVSHKKQL